MLTLSFFYHYLLSPRAGALVRTIAWLCILGIGVGVFAFILVLSVMNGFNRTSMERMLAADPHIIVDEVSIQNELLYSILGQNNVQSFDFLKNDVILRTSDGIFSGAEAKGMSVAYIKECFRRIDAVQRAQHLPDSRNLDWEDLAPGEVIIGIDLAQRLKVFEGEPIIVASVTNMILPLDEVPVYQNVKVKKIITTHVPSMDSSYLFYNSSNTLVNLKTEANTVKGVEIFLDDPFSYSKYMIDLSNNGFKARSWKEVNAALYFSLRLEKSMIGIFLGVSALIASFAIMTVLVLLISQKKRDIGMLVTMGMPIEQVAQVFSRVGMLLSFCGILWGTIAALIVCFLLQIYHIKMPQIYYDPILVVQVDYILVVLVMAFGLFIAWLSSLIPLRIVKLHPVQLLKATS